MFVTITKHNRNMKRGKELVFGSWFQGFSPLLAGTMYSGRTQVVREGLYFLKARKQSSLIQEGARARTILMAKGPNSTIHDLPQIIIL